MPNNPRDEPKRAPAILVTGASGFIGRAIARRLSEDGFAVRRHLGRTAPDDDDASAFSGDLCEGVPDAALRGCACVVHCAALVHDMKGSQPAEQYRRVNVEATLRLAREAQAAGVKRFIFLSTVKVNGEATAPDTAFSPSDPPNPTGAYAISKAEAERGLREIGAATGLEVVIIRLPLVHGPAVKANFRALLRLIDRGVPLPVGGVRNARSLLSVDNLADLLSVAVQHHSAPGRVLMASDGRDLSTEELARILASRLGRNPRIWHLPSPLLRLLGKASGQGAAVERLLGSLRVDISETAHLLGWVPPTTPPESLRASVDEYLRSVGR